MVKEKTRKANYRVSIIGMIIFSGWLVISLFQKQDIFGLFKDVNSVAFVLLIVSFIVYLLSRK